MTAISQRLSKLVSYWSGVACVAKMPNTQSYGMIW